MSRGVNTFEPYHPRRLLVTGGAGFIGCNFIRFLLRSRPKIEIVNLDLLTYAGRRENLEDVVDEPRHQLIVGDICDRDVVRDAMRGCDAVVHLAAETHVDRSIIDSAPFVKTNILGTQTLIDVARECEVRRFVQAGTDEVYGSLALGELRRFSEDSPLRPNSPYAASKAAGDLLVLSYCRTFDFPGIVTRSSNNFGPYQYPEKIIPLFVSNLLRGEKVPVYGDGQHVRDWIHVDDYAEAMLAALERGRIGCVYNISADNEHSNIELASLLLEMMGRDHSFIRHVADRPGHDRRYALDQSRIRSELGWSASRSDWPSALAQTVSWYRSHQAWCNAIRESESFMEYYRRQYRFEAAD